MPGSPGPDPGMTGSTVIETLNADLVGSLGTCIFTCPRLAGWKLTQPCGPLFV